MEGSFEFLGSDRTETTNRHQRERLYSKVDIQLDRLNMDQGEPFFFDLNECCDVETILTRTIPKLGLVKGKLYFLKLC